MHAANSVSDSTTGNSNTADHNAAFSRFASCLALQRSAYQADPVPQLKQRLADLDALKALIRDNEQALVDAVNADYGSRCRFETRFSEILMVLEDIARTKKQLKKWLKPQTAIGVSEFKKENEKIINNLRKTNDSIVFVYFNGKENKSIKKKINW